MGVLEHMVIGMGTSRSSIILNSIITVLSGTSLLLYRKCLNNEREISSCSVPLINFSAQKNQPQRVGKNLAL